MYKVHLDKKHNQKTNEMLVIGAATRILMKEANLSSAEENDICDCFRAYFSTACAYIINKFPIENEVIWHARLLMFLRKKR